ncbi:MAG: hypothetical protein FJW64_04295 [Actinobacteria bacterium]|nr:hypothetical protein [Actinomycetota bacterium]
MSELWADSRHRVAVVAAARLMHGSSSIVSHLSAAVLHGLPQYRFGERPVEVTTRGPGRTSGRPGLRRHHDALSDDDIVVVDGIACTSLDRTVFDVARTASTETAVACADAAVAREAMRGRRFDADAQAAWRARLSERAARARGRRGVRAARWVLDFADGRAELPGESVSRVQLHRLGFRAFELQVRVNGPDGGDYFVDVGLPEARTFWEFDGRAKYTEASLLRGRTTEEAFLEEKRREDWIRGVTQWRFCRGGFADIESPAALTARLRAFGVELPS